MLIDKDASVADLVAMGHDRATVKKIESLIYISEYKRFQSGAPRRPVTERAFLARPALKTPIVNRWPATPARTEPEDIEKGCPKAPPIPSSAWVNAR